MPGLGGRLIDMELMFQHENTQTWWIKWTSATFAWKNLAWVKKSPIIFSLELKIAYLLFEKKMLIYLADEKVMAWSTVPICEKVFTQSSITIFFNSDRQTLLRFIRFGIFKFYFDPNYNYYVVICRLGVVSFCG